MKPPYLTWAEIDLNAIRHNFREIRKVVDRNFISAFPRRSSLKYTDGPEILCVVKADAYGHGMIPVASALKAMGVKFWGVADVREARQLRENGFKEPILLLGTPLPAQAPEVVALDLMPAVCTLSLATAINAYAKKAKKTIDIHIKVDTGMGRLGVSQEKALDFILRVARFSHLHIKGLFTHFPLADTDPKFTREQISMLGKLINELDRRGIVIPYIHAANSMGCAGYRSDIFNLVRPGLMLYGQYPLSALKQKIKLIPVMSVKARIIYVKKVAKGQGISYGHIFVAKRAMTVATLAIGYNDGYLRCLSNKSKVLIGGQRCPLLGRVTMDQITVDVSRVKAPRIGMAATIMGNEGRAAVSADELAKLAGTINYEIVCSLGNRLPREYKG